MEKNDSQTITFYEYTPLRAELKFKECDDEFVCPETFELVAMEYCETFNFNNGCKFIKECKGYLKKKGELSSEG